LIYKYQKRTQIDYLKYKYQKRTHASKVQKRADQEKENKENPFLGWDVAIKLNID
jgi:hypothetical protein